ncbi:PREDICTED: protein transport protein SEC16B homolog [Ipomoea nil]|uniref:protein transport protein SEC16B homolog n=1 Tax=Ipomoea nil TaxID=35883 RepID=UPI0009013310|nr:PREDICTED: protein transport protein SEC16B homolog [Ipomoea nil]
MASNPPFHVEDQTDEDFFDKLVNDDGDNGELKLVAPTSGQASVDGNEFDEVKAFANLSLSDSNDNGNNETDGWETGIGDVGDEGMLIPDDVIPGSSVEENVVKRSASLDPLYSAGLNSSGECSNGNLADDITSDVAVDKSSVSGHSGVKEVGWSAFNAVPGSNGDSGFGSYSDFFTELGDGSGDADENVNIEPKIVSADQVPDSAYLNTSNSGMVSFGVATLPSTQNNTSNSYAQYQQNYSYGAGADSSVDGQNLNSSQYWENLYPGWKYDPITGQWYQVDYAAGANVQGGYGANLSANWENGKTQVSYLQQTAAQSVAGAEAESGTTENVTNWNQVAQANNMVADWNHASQVNNGYPSHMIFDPNYPGWYYDTIAQEWRSLDTYINSSQSTIEGENKLNQNGYASSMTFSQNNEQMIHGAFAQADTTIGQQFSSKGLGNNLSGSFGHYNQQTPNTWQTKCVATSEPMQEFKGNQRAENSYGHDYSATNQFSQPMTNNYDETSIYHGSANQSQSEFSLLARSQGLASTGSFSQQFLQPTIEQNELRHSSSEYLRNQNSFNFSQPSFQSSQQFTYAPSAERSSAGRPPHTLVTFGFGGKLILMKHNSSLGNSSFGNENSGGGSISVLDLVDIVTEKVDSSVGTGTSSYLRTLCQQSFPGPLVGGSVGSKELNKWIDDRIAHSGSPVLDYRKAEVLRLLLSLLKIGCQYYGKLRSPFGTDTAIKESDAPETAVARLFASTKSSVLLNQYGAATQCVQRLPSEGQMQATAAEVQRHLVSGRKNEALQCAQDGQLWGPALVLAAQLGEQFYVDTVKQMALRQLVPGSPLRTLCLLIAGQPAAVFSAGTLADGYMPGALNIPQQPSQFGANGMLDDWEENLAMITANRTKDDELVLIHLGDCLWKERNDIVAAHICYLVAEANFEPYSDTARLCLVGANHWKFPRTYASPEAIQRTELFEYSKMLGNSQFILLPFQPYKLVYAHMLAEVGKISDALKYSQALLKSLKTGRAPEVETLRQLSSSLEERIRTHQQGGFSANLAPAKLVGKLLNLFDSTAHRVVGGLPPPAPSSINTQANEQIHQSVGPRVSNSQSTMAMSSLVPSTSMEPISDLADNGSRKTFHNRSISEPDFGKSSLQGKAESPPKDATPSTTQENASGGGTSRFSRFSFGSQLIQKTMGLVLKSRQGRQAKLGEQNKFYYDEKLKRWVEEGAEPPAEEAAVAPPPTTASFQNGASDYNLRNALKNESPSSNGTPELKSPALGDSSGMPPLPPTSSNQFSARSRTGVRSRYVDTFNKGGGNATNLFHSPSAPSTKPATHTQKFFVPAPVVSSEQPVDSSPDSSIHDTSPNNDNPSASPSLVNDSFQPPRVPSDMTKQRFGSTGSLSNNAAAAAAAAAAPTSFAVHARRTASWSGSFSDDSSPECKSDIKLLGDVPSFIPTDTSFAPSRRCGSFGDGLHQVAL